MRGLLLSVASLTCGLATLVAALWASPPADALEGPRVGIFAVGDGPRRDTMLAGLREGFRLGRLDPVILERSVSDADEAARGTLAEFAFERVDVVFVLGAEGARLARDTLRSPAVVFLDVGYPDAHGLPGRGNVCGVADGVDARETLGWLRRAAPGTGRVLVVRDGPSAAADRLEERVVASGLRPVRGDVEMAGPSDAVWLAPEVPDETADRLARVLAGTGVPLVGSRRGHLDAGCSLVVRCDPRDAGLLAAALARRILAGEAPGEIGVRQVARRRVEVNLDAARRLGHDVPVVVVAAADHVLPALGRRE